MTHALFKFALSAAMFGVLSSQAQAGAGGTFLSQAAGPADANARPNIVLGGSSGSPGQVVVVPIYYTPPQGVEVGSLKLEITFVSVNLKYEKIEPGVAAEMADVSVSANLAVGKDEKEVETSTLTVSASSPPGGTQKAVPSGLLAYLTLRISETGRPATITLRTKVEAAELGTNKRLDNMQSADATVEVIAPGSEPLVSCFFFTH